MEELFEKNPDKICFKMGLQGISGEFWFYETHFKGISFKFLVPEEIAKDRGFERKMKLSEIKEFVLIKGIDYR